MDYIPVLPKHFMKQQKLSSFINPKNAFGNTVRLPSMMVIGMEIVFKHENFPEYQESRLLWQKFNQRLHQIPNRMQTKGWEKWGILYHHFDEIKKKTSKYLACVQVSDLNQQITSMVGIQIPTMQWQKHLHRGALIDLPTTLNQLGRHNMQKDMKLDTTRLPSQLFFDHIEHYDHRFHWSKPSSEIDVYTLVN